MKRLAGAIYLAVIMQCAPAHASYIVTVDDCRSAASRVRYAAVLRDTGYPRAKLELEMKTAKSPEPRVISNSEAIELAYVDGQSLSAMQLYDITLFTCMHHVTPVQKFVPNSV